jgi:hypothetical protein
MQVDAGAGRNKRMFDEVKKGDRVLIPHLPRYGHITVAEATEDWNLGYDFSIWEKSSDHGHIFPARCLAQFPARQLDYKGFVKDDPLPQILKAKVNSGRIAAFQSTNFFEILRERGEQPALEV